MKLLAGPYFWWHFFLWALFEEKPIQKRRMIRVRTGRILKWSGWLLCLAPVGFLAFANPWEYLEDDTLLMPVALAQAAPAGRSGIVSHKSPAAEMGKSSPPRLRMYHHRRGRRHQCKGSILWGCALFQHPFGP
jgi:hypothetical protein